MAQEQATKAAPEAEVIISGYDVTSLVRKLAIVIAYVATSTALIRFNKHMMHKDVFPFSLALSAIHMMVSFALCGLLYVVRPSMFPAMEKIQDQRLDLMKWFLPIGACFAVMLYGSNQAYIYCSVALLQFMKEANVMIVFLISCAVGLQVMNRLRLALIVWVIIGAAISVSGDLQFALVGVAFQAMSQVAECARIVLGEFVLSGRKLDPLTYTTFVAPTCFVVLMAGNALAWDPAIIPAAMMHWRLLAANACVAFLLNVLVATVIKEVSAVGFVLTGLTKDIVIVVLSCVMFMEPITHTQASAFIMTLAGVGMWSLMKINPQAAPVQFLERALCMPVTALGEKDPLLPCKKV